MPTLLTQSDHLQYAYGNHLFPKCRNLNPWDWLVVLWRSYPSYWPQIVIYVLSKPLATFSGLQLQISCIWDRLFPWLCWESSASSSSSSSCWWSIGCSCSCDSPSTSFAFLFLTLSLLFADIVDRFGLGSGHTTAHGLDVEIWYRNRMGWLSESG